MKRNHRIFAALLSVCMCLAPVPMPVSGAAASSLPKIIAEADAARSDYRIRTLDFPAIDRSDMIDGMAYKLADNCYALQGWGVFHAEDYINTDGARGPYYSATAIVNRRGDFLIPWQPTMSAFHYEVTFADGVYSIVYNQGLDGGSLKETTAHNVSEYYDAEGHVLFAHEPFVAAGPMQDGVAWVAYPSDGDSLQVQLIDKTGAKIADLPDQNYWYISNFSEGLANYGWLDADGSRHYGYFDRTGKIVLETDNLCGDFHNGLAKVKIDGKYGFMDTSGKLVIPAEYTALGDNNGFTAESVLVKKGDNWALIDTSGKLLTDFIYTISPFVSFDLLEHPADYVYDAGSYPFVDGYTTVYRDGRFFVLDTKGREVMKDLEKPVYSFGNGLFGVGKTVYGSAYDIIDSSGDTILTQDIGMLSNRGNGVFLIVGDGPYRFFEVEPAATASVIPGDVNGDGTPDIMDVIMLNKHLLGSTELDAYGKKAADMNEDEKVDSEDALAVLKAVLGIRSASGQEESTVSLSAKFAGQPVQNVDIGEQTILGQTKFALELLRESAKAGENTLVSPYSVSQALGMTANGARDKTLSEMEDVLGGSMETLNPAFYTMRTSAPQTEDAKLSTANSIWVRNGYAVRQDFLQKNADFYGADAYSAPFDSSTVEAVNGWVNEKTDQMIPTILEGSDVTETTRIILVNAVAFDAKWMEPYEEDNIREQPFTAADGTKQTVKMMSRSLHTYLEDEHATGFLQSYMGGDYAFAAILPEEGMTPEAYLADLTPERLHKMLAEPIDTKVVTGIPEFKYDYGDSLVDELKTMGMPTAFSTDADFFAMTDDPRGLLIGDVIHKTHIEVTPVGTRAGAATAVVMRDNAAVFLEDPKEVILDRPFVYAIVDTKTSLPVFFGIVNSVQ